MGKSVFILRRSLYLDLSHSMFQGCKANLMLPMMFLIAMICGVSIGFIVRAVDPSFTDDNRKLMYLGYPGEIMLNMLKGVSEQVSRIIHKHFNLLLPERVTALRARFMGPIWGPSGAERTQVSPSWPNEFSCLGVNLRQLDKTISWTKYDDDTPTSEVTPATIRYIHPNLSTHPTTMVTQRSMSLSRVPCIPFVPFLR